MLQGGQVGPAFFAALSRVRAIHDNCRALLRGHHQRAGLELMDQMSAYQEAGYEALCRCAVEVCWGGGRGGAGRGARVRGGAQRASGGQARQRTCDV